MRNLRSTSLCVLAFAMAMPGQSFAQAQAQAQSKPEPAYPDEIMVTARKQSENVQKVPDAISVVTSANIEDAGITNVRDFAKLIPNVAFDRGGSAAYSVLSARGITTPQGAEAPMAIVVDGVQLPDLTFANVDLLNLERIEVLRGPQGSLYGRNAIAGAINFVTKTPTNDFSFMGKAMYANGDDRKVQAVVSGPIVKDAILFSLAGSYRKFDGIYPNVLLNKPADSEDSKTLRAGLFINPTEALKIVARFNYTDAANGAAHDIVTDAQIPLHQSFLAYSTPLFQYRKLYEGSVKIDYDLGPATLTSVSALNKANQRLYGDGDFGPFPLLIQEVLLKIKTFSQEVRLASNNTTGLRWLAGGFYQLRKTNNFLLLPYDDGTGKPYTAANFPANYVNFIGQPDTDRYFIESRDHGRSKAYAFFGQAVADLTDTVEATVGLRYDHDERSSVDSLVPASATKASFHALQPKVSLMYKWADNFQTYATVARGFRSGGFNAFTSNLVPRKYDQETNWSYELGFKGNFLDRRLSLTGAVFIIDMKNEQLYFLDTVRGSQNIVVLPKTQKTGVELEMIARPVENLDITLGIGTADSIVKSYPANPTFVGNKTYQANAYNMSATVQYRIPLSDALTLRPYASVERRGPVYWDVENTIKTGPKNLVNLRLFLESEHWSIGGFVNNLNNTWYPTAIGTHSFGPQASLRDLNVPRSYGIEATANF